MHNSKINSKDQQIFCSNINKEIQEKSEVDVIDPSKKSPNSLSPYIPEDNILTRMKQKRQETVELTEFLKTKKIDELEEVEK